MEDWLLLMATTDAQKLAAYPNELYDRPEPVCKAICAARDALMTRLSAEQLEELRRETFNDVKTLLGELDASKGR